MKESLENLAYINQLETEFKKLLLGEENDFFIYCKFNKRRYNK